MKESKAKVTLNGQVYRLRFDVWALEQIEDEFGGVREAFESLRGKKMSKSVKTLFRIMANCKRNADGLPENVTGDEIPAHASIGTLTEVAAAVKAAVAEGMESETNGGEADDDVHDGYAEEYDRKNG